MSKSEDDDSLKDQLFVIKFRELLENYRSNEAAYLFAKAESEGVVARSLWEIVPILVSSLTKENQISRGSLFDTCEELLLEVAHKCNPKEMLLLLLERVKNTEDEATFGCLMKALRDSLMRSGPSRGIDWCVLCIKNYIIKLPQPENEKTWGEENEYSKKADPLVERLIVDYKSVLTFLEPLVVASSLNQPSETKTRHYVLGLHLLLFGYPFCYLNTRRTNESSIFEATLVQMSHLTGNFLRFHGIIEDRSTTRKINVSEEEEDYPEENMELELFKSEKNVSDLAYANYYYYLLNSEEGKKNIPQVYDPRYLMRGCFYLSNCMLKQPEYVLVTKGLRIVEAVLEKIEKFSIDHEVLETSVHHDLFASLTQVMIYCDADNDRKMAFKVFQALFDRFNIRARYLLLLSLYETSNHSGILALLINITKVSIVHCLDQDPRCEHFLGSKLERLLGRICRLPNGNRSDLVEISDQVIAALNLLRFLVIRDRDNSTGIWRIIDYLEKEYLKPLREGIDMSRAHWKVKIRDLEERVKNIKSSARATARLEETIDQEITVTVGGEDLPMMPASEKINFSRQAINALDIMESIVIRVNECIQENPQRSR